MSEIKQNYPLAPLTTLKIGGPAEFYLETKSNTELIEVLQLNQKGNINVFAGTQRTRGLASPKVASTAKNIDVARKITMLGNGSNVLISDSGISGLVVRNLSRNIQIEGKTSKSLSPEISYAARTENEPDKYLDFASLDYDESDQPRIKVTLDAGTPLPLAINYLISQGITGLQWFAYIPGTIGGATWYNIHGGKYNLSTYIDSVEYFNLSSGKVENLNFANKSTSGAANNFSAHSDRPVTSGPEGSEHSKNSFASQKTFDYETSPFQLHPDWVILSTTLNLYLGDTQKAAAVVQAWIAQKSKVQPMNSAGSTFQNPSLDDSIRNWGEQKSTGWIIDHELGWKGKNIGGAQISLQHANFIINTGSATATDYLTLANLIIDEVQKRFGFKLKLEVKLLGNFD